MTEKPEKPARENIIKSLTEAPNYLTIQTVANFTMFVLSAFTFLFPFKFSKFSFWIIAIFDLGVGIAYIQQQEKITFDLIYHNYFLHSFIILSSFAKYKVSSLLFVTSLVITYATEVCKLLSSEKFSEDLRKISEYEKPYDNQIQFYKACIEIACPLELLLYSAFSKRSQGYTLVLIEYLILILPFKHCHNEFHRQVWNKISLHLNGNEYHDLFVRPKAILWKIARFIITLDDGKQKTD